MLHTAPHCFFWSLVFWSIYQRHPPSAGVRNSLRLGRKFRPSRLFDNELTAGSAYVRRRIRQGMKGRMKRADEKDGRAFRICQLRGDSWSRPSQDASDLTPSGTRPRFCHLLCLSLICVCYLLCRLTVRLCVCVCVSALHSPLPPCPHVLLARQIQAGGVPWRTKDWLNVARLILVTWIIRLWW
ncbi:hypothetical protein LZ31DRAFT_142887 [Colletotrichum somersetense]|nr:hypothetical protein LZ31DRAFT_142887 [Colletotrichum somersetense]